MAKHIEIGKVSDERGTKLWLNIGKFFGQQMQDVMISKRSKIAKTLKLKVGDKIKITFQKVK